MSSAFVAVGSTNPAKIHATQKIYSLFYANTQISGVRLETGVSRQPLNGDLYIGARNRAVGAIKAAEATYGVGIEAGLFNINNRIMNTACCVILDQKGVEHVGYSVMFEVPLEILKFVEQGMELGQAVDRFTGKKDTGHKEGLVGILSQGHLDRERMLSEAVLMALMEFF
jgi:inosine/xanthosine triphosphatase